MHALLICRVHRAHEDLAQPTLRTDLVMEPIVAPAASGQTVHGDASAAGPGAPSICGALPGSAHYTPSMHVQHPQRLQWQAA